MPFSVNTIYRSAKQNKQVRINFAKTTFLAGIFTCSFVTQSTKIKNGKIPEIGWELIISLAKNF